MPEALRYANTPGLLSLLDDEGYRPALGWAIICAAGRKTKKTLWMPICGIFF